jgi:pilus assembly protein TadC
MLSIFLNLVIGMNTTHVIDNRISYVLGFLLAMFMPNFIIGSDWAPLFDFIMEAVGKVALGGCGAVGVYFTNKAIKYFERKRKRLQ